MTQRERSAQAQPQTGTCRARTDLTGQGVPLTGVHTQTRGWAHTWTRRLTTHVLEERPLNHSVAEIKSPSSPTSF